MRYVFCFLVLLLMMFCGTVEAQHYKIDSLLNVLPKTENDKDRIHVLNALAFLYSLGSVQEAEKFTKEAIEKSRAINYKPGLAEAYKILGLVYMVRSEYNVAMEYSYQSLKLYETLADKSGRSKVLNNLALILMSQKEYGRAYDFSLQSLKLKREIGDSLGVANSTLSLADYFRSAGNYEKALQLCRQSITSFEQLNNEMGKGYAHFTMGEIFLAQRKYETASDHYHKAIRFARQANDYIQIINTNKQLGKLFLDSQQYDSAYVYLHKTMRMAVEKKNRNNEMEINQYLADYFAATAQLDSALYYTRKAAAIEREIFNSQKQEQISNLQTLYDFEKKEQELIFQKKIVRRQYVAIIGVSLILLLSVLFGFRIYSLNKSNQQANEALIQLNFEINKINANLENIVQERTEEIKLQNQKLIEYAFFTAHEVRGPLARILGLIELAKIKDLSEEDKRQIMVRLEDASNELDEVIRTINRKLESARR